MRIPKCQYVASHWRLKQGDKLCHRSLVLPEVQVTRTFDRVAPTAFRPSLASSCKFCQAVGVVVWVFISLD